MEIKPPGFCTVVALLGISSAAAGIAGDATMDWEMGFSFYFSIILPALAIITRIYISGCSCCRNDPKSTPMSKRFSIFSWVATVAVVILMVSAILCLWDGIFALAGVLSLLSAVLAIASYVTAENQARETATNSAVSPKVNPMTSPPQQYYPPPQYAPQQFPPQQFSPRQYPPQ